MSKLDLNGKLIFEGKSTGSAISSAAVHFNRSESDIWDIWNKR